MSIQFDDGARLQLPTLSLTIGIGRREGNFLLTPDAVVDDGWLDYLHAGALSRWELIRLIPRMINGRLPTDHPQIRSGRCRQVRIESATPLTVHLDGEFFCLPEEDVHQLEIEIIPAALRTQVGKAKAFV
jgi:diacylglycerol kinase family enzyme